MAGLSGARRAVPRGGAVPALVAGLLALTAPLAACTGRTPQRAPTGALSPDATITWALDSQPLTYNPNATDGDSPANAAVLSSVLGAFWRFAPDGTVQRTPDFGTYQKISDDPLTVKYVIDPRAVWSDGVPVDCEDVALAWLANSGVTGEKGFSALAVDRYRDMNRPRCEDGDKTFTVTYRAPVADWETAFGPGSAWLLPAHVVRREAGLKNSFVEYLDTPRAPDLAPAIAFWNRGWTFTPGQVRKEVVLSSGPYVIDSWQAGTSITLRPNPRWWGRPPGTGTVVVRFLDPARQAAALRAGEIQAMAPQLDPAALAAALAQLKAAKPGTVRITPGYRTDLEHLDFNVKGAFADRALREAFTRCLPRKQIVDKAVAPVVPGARALQSRFLLPFQPGYADTDAAGKPYEAVDVAGAKRLLAGRTPTVRIGWRKDPDQLNTGRLDTIGMIKTSCQQAGFTVVDAGTPTFFDREWPQGAFDVALFSWTTSPGATAGTEIYTSGGAANPTGYANPQVDKLFRTLAREPRADRRAGLQRQLDALLWQDLATVPIFAYPAVTATSADVQGVVANPMPTGLAWNVEEWRR